MENIQSKRYSEKELTFFKNLIDKKLAKAERQLASLDAQLKETTADKSSESDWVDDSSNSANLQLLDTMANRLRKHIVDLKNAQLRVHNKSYGICAITGSLIDKKRLIAVPTTTKSVAAKTGKIKDDPKSPTKANNAAKKENVPKIISRVIPKTATSKKNTIKREEEDVWEKADHLLNDVEQLDLEEEMED